MSRKPDPKPERVRLRSSQCGTWPAGLHWTPGEARDIELPRGALVPPWLTLVEAEE